MGVQVERRRVVSRSTSREERLVRGGREEEGGQ